MVLCHWHWVWPTAVVLLVVLTGCDAASGPAGQPPDRSSSPGTTSRAPISSPPADSSPANSPERNSPGWGPVELVSGESYRGDAPAVAVAIRGRRMIAAWEAHTKPPNRSGVSLIKVAERIAGTWGEPQVIGELNNLSGGSRSGIRVALGPRRTATVVWSQRIDGTDWLVARDGEGGRWSPLQRLGHGFAMGVVRDSAGNTMVVSIDDGGVLTSILRPTGGRWGGEEVVARRAYNPTLAANGRGDVVVAWSEATGVAVVTRRFGRPWADVVTIRSQVRYPWAVCAAIDTRSRAVVLWGLDLEEDDAARRHLAWSATSGDGTWSDPGYLDRHRPSAVGATCRISMNAKGRAVASWENLRGPRTATFDFGRGWSRARALERGSDPWIADEGTAVMVTGDGEWMLRRPDGTWGRRGAVFDGVRYVDAYRLAADSTGRRLALVYYGDQVIARVFSSP